MLKWKLSNIQPAIFITVFCLFLFAAFKLSEANMTQTIKPSNEAVNEPGTNSPQAEGEIMITREDTNRAQNTEPRAIKPTSNRKLISRGETIGNFVKAYRKEYPRFVVRLANGIEEEFCVKEQSIDSQLFEQFEKNPTYTGKNVRVKWEEFEVFSPDGNSTYSILEMLELKLED